MVPAMRMEHSVAKSVLKGEDLVLVGPLSSTYPKVMVYLICDGHSGVDAAALVVNNFRTILLKNLGRAVLDTSNEELASATTYADTIRRALCETFVDVENLWRQRQHLAGTTVTLALLIRDLLTVANVGDSSMVLDTGCSTLELTCSHRLQANAGERARLKKADRVLAQLGLHLQGPAKPGEMGVGPLRIWPGGLCVSRSIGDVDVGPEVVPLPHIKQFVVPTSGCRLIMASDGLWDHMSPRKAAKVCRASASTPAAELLVETIAARPRGATDDVSVVVVDFLPAGAASFADVAAAVAPVLELQRKSSRSGLLGCFHGLPWWEEDEVDARDANPGAGHVGLLADVDGLYAYCHLLEQIDCSHSPKREGDDGGGIERKYTLHEMSSLRPPSTSGASSAASLVSSPSNSVHPVKTEAAARGSGSGTSNISNLGTPRRLLVSSAGGEGGGLSAELAVLQSPMSHSLKRVTIRDPQPRFL